MPNITKQLIGVEDLLLAVNTVVTQQRQEGTTLVDKPVTGIDAKAIPYNTTDTVYDVLHYLLLNGGSGGTGSGGQLLGAGATKGIQYMAQASEPGEDIIIASGTNAFSVDSFLIEEGASITIEDGSVYKIL